MPNSELPFPVNSFTRGDSMNLLDQLDDNSVPLLLTDIPYNVVNRASGGLRNLDKGVADIGEFDLDVLARKMARVTSGSLYVFCGTEQVSQLRASFVDAGLTTRLCIWEKTNPSPMNSQYLWMSSIETCVFARKRGAVFNDKYQSPVWRYPTVRSKRHPTEKPLKLFERLVEISSNPSDVVLDPFMGSGTTAEAALRQGRSFVGFDLEDEFIRVAQERVADLMPASQ